MKPKPFESLNHFTVPVAIYLRPSTESRDKAGRDEAGHDNQGRELTATRTTLLAAGEGYKFAARYPAGRSIAPFFSPCYDAAMTDLSAFWRINPSDADPIETREWLDAFDTLVETAGRERATFLLRKLLDHARVRRVPLPPVLNTPYKNSVSLADQPQFPGNLELEQRISSIVRWNALAMVVRANRAYPELGGHIASYASAADLFEVGFNHFFRSDDLVYFQPHSAPGVYARAFLEGRLSEEQLSNYRRETGGKGLCSYCHPYLMPQFWQFPTGSMGLGPLNAIYQARFMRYLEHRGILKTAGRKVWAFVGDGEMDEPESLAALSLAARDGLDNLIFVVNCNLQRLDGPVRGNGSIVQELEGLFAGAGWNVIKLLWGSDWDGLFARDHDGVLLKRLHETVDGEFQMYAATDGRFNREHFFNKYPELTELIADMSDDDIDRLHRGGHDPVKIYAAYRAAVEHAGGTLPAELIAQSVDNNGFRAAARAAHEGRNARRAGRADRRRRGAHLRHADAVQAVRHLLGPRAALRARGPRGAALLPRGEGRPDPRGRHHGGGRAFIVARRGDLVFV